MAKKRAYIGAVAAILCAIATLSQAGADQLPTRIGQCSQTTITRIGTRLEDGVTHRPMPNSGSAVDFANGGHQVSYDTLSQISHSQVGDPVKLCLVSIPRGCPPGDDGGRVYKTTNLRTHQSWRLPDSEHNCGGA